MFKSRNTIEHLLRGLVGFGLLAIALSQSERLGWWSFALFAGALVSFRGCPMCWMVGLVETAFSGKARLGCADGSCGTSAIAADPSASSTRR
jgi:hypothetical protein